MMESNRWRTVALLPGCALPGNAGSTFTSVGRKRQGTGRYLAIDSLGWRGTAEWETGRGRVPGSFQGGDGSQQVVGQVYAWGRSRHDPSILARLGHFTNEADALPRPAVRLALLTTRAATIRTGGEGSDPTPRLERSKSFRATAPSPPTPTG